MDDFLIRMIKEDQFSEIHCNIFNDHHLKSFLNSMKHNFQCTSHFLRGFFYLYCHFVEKESEEQILMKEFKKNAHAYVITFSISPEKAFSNLEFVPTKPFFHCKTGFKYDYLRIFLNYVPLYDSETDKKAFIPSDVSNLCLGYISPPDFLRASDKRVQILIDDEANKNHHIKKYVNFNDIHSVRSEFFVEDALLVTKMAEVEIKEINRIKSQVDLKIDKNKKFHRRYLLELLKNNRFKECLQYVTYAYSHFIRSSIPDCAIHRAQIYAAFEACKTCFSVKKDKNQQGTKGVIYQVETGEGKSCIVCLIAAVLAIKKYTVHIASSNIKLSNRDYYNSYDFFRLLGLKSAVLLHKNELPYSNNEVNNQDDDEDENDEDDQIPMKNVDRDEEDDFFKNNADYYFEVNTKKSNELYKKSYPDEFFADDLFKNPSRMNFSVCGLDNDNTISKNKANVIFSTFVNFECFYLHLMEMCPGYIDSYFKNCGLLIVEADSILIDEITNGTIVSREIKSNAKEVLSFVYDQKKNKKTADETYQALKKNPMLSDLKLSDIEQMYKEIELVNSEEFSDGKEYYVESFEVRNNHRIRNLIKKTIKSIINIKDKIADIIDQKLFNKIAGLKGAVSLGTKVCGRGTDIQVSELPLHVIVSFFSSSVRVMNQAFSRTARQGQRGTRRCICLKEQVNKKIGDLNLEKTKKAVNDFEIKIDEQKSLSNIIKKQDLGYLILI